MTKKKTTKRSLIASLLVLIMCVSMFVGSTFAWFTDSVVTGNNKIIAGNLDVELEYANAPDGTYLNAKDAEDIFVAPAGTEKGLWEPGHTEVAYLKVTNKGTLALKYNLSVSPFTEVIGRNENGEDIKLSEILKFGATEPTENVPAAYTRESAQAAASASAVKLNDYLKTNVTLDAGKSQYITLVVYMPEEVGNEANYRGGMIPSIEFAVTLLATQETYENDSFGNKYDENATYENGFYWLDAVSETVTPDANNKFEYVNADKTLKVSGEAENDVKVDIKPVANDADFMATLSNGKDAASYDITVEGHVDGSFVDVEMFVGKGLENLVLYHEGVEMDSAAYTYNAETGFVNFTTDDFSVYTVAYKSLTATPDVWDGTVDTRWYIENVDNFKLSTAEQFAGLAKLVDEGKTFEGVTITLESAIDLNNILFDPIGSYRNDKIFMGAFDGQGNTIYNLSQNTWDLNNGYYYGDLGLGLFAAVENAVIKNITVDGAKISGESALCGTIAAVSGGTTTFENITVKNANVADYQYYAGGIVGWASGKQTFKDINVDASTIIAGQWGDFDNSNGGVIGGIGGSSEIILKDCDIACRIDSYNDVTSSYQWFAYRRSGMIVGNSGKTVTENGRTVAVAPQLTCENVTVTYGDWANYHYCKFAGTSWPWVRVEEGISNSAYSNPRYGHPTDANGNTVVDDTHVHNAGEEHMELIAFDQLYGGGQGVYGNPVHEGVTVVYNNK